MNSDESGDVAHPPEKEISFAMNLSRFQCRRCGTCCKWEGAVRVSHEEIVKIAEFLYIDLQEFLNHHTVLTPDRRSLSLLEKEDGSCIYYDEKQKACLIQPVKPHQCSSFPFEWNFPGWDELCEGGKALREK